MIKNLQETSVGSISSGMIHVAPVQITGPLGAPREFPHPLPKRASDAVKPCLFRLHGVVVYSVDHEVPQPQALDVLGQRRSQAGRNADPRGEAIVGVPVGPTVLLHGAGGKEAGG